MVDYGSTNYGNEDVDEKKYKRQQALLALKRTVGRMAKPITEANRKQHADYNYAMGERAAPDYRKQSTTADNFQQSRGPSVPAVGNRVAEPPMDTSGHQKGFRPAPTTKVGSPGSPTSGATPVADPTIESETSGATRETTRIPLGSGGSKQGTGNILLTNTQGNPAGEIIGDVSGFKARRQPRAMTSAESRFRNAVSSGGRGRAARRPGVIVNEPTRQPTVQEEIGPLNKLSDYIREGAKLKARKTQADIAGTMSNIQKDRDLASEASSRTALDRRKQALDEQSAPDQNRERRARADAYEQDARINKARADLQDQYMAAETPEQRQQAAQALQDLEARAPKAEKSGAMTEYQRAQVEKDAGEAYQAWQTLDPKNNKKTYDEWLEAEGSRFNKYLGETAGPEDGQPEPEPLPPPGSQKVPGVPYRAANGQIVIYNEKGGHKVVSQ